MEDAKQQLVDKLKSATNVLVTVSRNPSVDQLAACIGLTLLLDKQGKHAVSVFSGEVPSTLEFLEPDKTIEKTTDSLRDFIISLDKNKADKLRYKVEDNVVRIFITPYKTSITPQDFEFSQGDFNVEVIVALGVHEQQDLDQAITDHGRILHDATPISINTVNAGELGAINWFEPQASSLSELVAQLAEALDPDLLDEQIATALLTGIVAETDRFSNDKTSSETMIVSSMLMAAGANQQLVASKLQQLPSNQANDGALNLRSQPGAASSAADPAASSDGLIAIDHAEAVPLAPDWQPAASPGPAPGSPGPAPATDQPVDFSLPASEFGSLPSEQGSAPTTSPPADPGSGLTPGPKLMTEPPTWNGTLTANSREEQLDPMSDPLSLPSSQPQQLLNRDAAPAAPLAVTPPPAFPQPPSPAPASQTTFQPSSPQAQPWTPPPAFPTPAPTPSPPTPTPADTKERSLADIEDAVRHADVESTPYITPTGNLDAARDEVSRALNDGATTETPEPIQALGAQPLGNELHPVAVSSADAASSGAGPGPNLQDILSHTEPDAPTPAAPPTVPNLRDDPATTPPPDDNVDPPFIDTNAPPPVPPPIPFQFGNSPPAP